LLPAQAPGLASSAQASAHAGQPECARRVLATHDEIQAGLVELFRAQVDSGCPII